MDFFQQTDIDEEDALLYEPEQMCNITTNKNMNIIHSNFSPNTKLKFDQSSFCFQSTTDRVQLHFNPMFLWRLINYQNTYLKKNDVDLDFVRVRTFVSKCISATSNFAVLVSEKNISYKQYGITINKKTSDSVLHTNLVKAFDQLYLSLKRNYDSYDMLISMFDVYIHILYFLSC